MTVTVRFSDFWNDSDSTIDKFLVPLIENVYQAEVRLVNDSRVFVDLEVFSVFPPKSNFSRRALNRISKYSRETSRLMEGRIQSNSSKRIWFSGESKRAPLANQYDAYLGYEPEGLLPNLHYLPLWVLNFDNFGKGPAHGFTSIQTSQEQLLLPRKYSRATKANFCCAFLGNPTSFRLGILKKLGEIEPIGLFGSAFGNKVSDKLLVSSNYKFSFTFENNLYPGYVTEKLLEGYLSQNVPLYWGLDSLNYFNPKAFVNLSKFENFEEFMTEVKALNADEDLYAQTYEQPLLNRTFDIADLVKKLRDDLL
jgi:hypothetical protein